MFDFVARAGLFEFVVAFIALCTVISLMTGRKGANEARSLQRENHRLRNIVANLMIDNAQIRDTR